MDSVAGMRVLVQVVAAGSFSGAARQLNVAPSSISRKIDELELDLGIRVFQRTTRKLSLTEAGALYYDHAVRILQDIDEARLAIAQLGSPSGILRITAPSGIGREVVASAIPAFIERYPGVKVVMSMTDETVDLVEGRIDVAIQSGPLSDSSLRAHKIGESRRRVCASPAYLKRFGEPTSVQALEQHDCLTDRSHPGKSTWSFRKSNGVSTDVTVTGSFFSHSADVLVAAAVAGMGVVLLPDWNMGIELRQEQLKIVLQEYEVIPSVSPIWAVHGHGRYLPPKVEAFVNFMAEKFSPMQTMNDSPFPMASTDPILD